MLETEKQTFRIVIDKDLEPDLKCIKCNLTTTKEVARVHEK